MSSNEQAPPPPADTSPLDFHDDGPAMNAGFSVLLTLATIFVALRLWSRRLSGAGWKLDDWLVVAALVVHHVFMVCAFIMVIVGGLGRDIRLVATEDPNNVVVLFQALLGAEVCYGFSSSLVKLSVLAFYRRIFPTNTVQWGALILGGMCIGWTVAIQIVNFTQCRPLEAFWHIEMQGLPTTYCIDTILYFLWNSMANCVIDLFTLLLPIRDVMRLRTTTSKKLGIAAIFLLGSVALAASLVRTITTAHMWEEGNINFSQQFVVPGVTTVVETYVAIIGACLPTMLPVYRKLRYGDARGATSVDYSAKSYRTSSSKKPSKQQSEFSIMSPTVNDGSFERLQGEDLVLTDMQHGYTVDASSNGPADSRPTSRPGLPAKGIVVRSDVIWSEDPSNRV